jgi:hypothetical protein
MKLLLAVGTAVGVLVLIVPLTLSAALGSSTARMLCTSHQVANSPDPSQQTQPDGCRGLIAQPGSGRLVELEGAPSEIAAAVDAALAMNGLRSGWKDLCDRLVCRAYGYLNSGYPDASVHWRALLASGHARAGDRCPPTGAFVFWATGRPEGHVAIVVRADLACDPRRIMLISNDVLDRPLHRNGGVYLVSLADIEGGFMSRQRYQGWTDPICAGVTLAAPSR